MAEAQYLMFIVYILKSLKNAKRHVGYTSKSAVKRLHEHNTGSNKFTSRNGPFILLYQEEWQNKTEAIRRERFLKSGKGRECIDNLRD